MNKKGEKNAMSKIFTQERRFVYNPQTLSLEYYSGQEKTLRTINLQNAKVECDYQVIKIKPYGDGEARTYEISSNNKNKISALKRVIDHIPPSSELQDMNHIHQTTEANDDSQRSSEFQTESLTATLWIRRQLHKQNQKNKNHNNSTQKQHQNNPLQHQH